MRPEPLESISLHPVVPRRSVFVVREVLTPLAWAGTGLGLTLGSLFWDAEEVLGLSAIAAVVLIAVWRFASVVAAARLTTLLDAVDGSVLQLDVRGRIVAANHSAAEMFGYRRRRDLVGLHVGTLVVEISRPAPGRFERTGVTTSGRTFPLEVSIASVEGGYVVLGRDATLSKLRERADLDSRRRVRHAMRKRTAQFRMEKKRLEESQVEMLHRLARAGEYRDEDTHRHTERVGELASRIALELGCDEEWVRLLRLAAPLHDLGKLGIPDGILYKRGALTPAEWARVRRHTLDGARLLGDGTSEAIRLAEEIALSHHEHWDGSGYPFGLAGEAIPLSGRIVAVADSFDALTHHRPYKEAWSVDCAMALVREERGRRFDPDVVDAFARIRSGDLLDALLPKAEDLRRLRLVLESPDGADADLGSARAAGLR